MPLIVVDARGLTFRPSGARTRLLGLFSAYRRLPEAFDLRVLAVRGRGAQALLAEHEVACVEMDALSAGGRALTAVRLTGSAFSDADVVHRETYPAPLLNSAPVVLTIHDLRSIERPELSSSKLKGAYERRVLPVTARFVDAIVAVSQTTADAIHTHLHVPRERISVVPNGVTAPRRPDASGVADAHLPDRFLLAFGHIEPRKNLQTLIPLMTLLAEQDDWPVRTLIVAGRDLGGAHALREAYEALDQPRFSLDILTDVDDSLKAALLARADCLLSPSVLEGFGIVPLEALAVGTPAVVSDVPASREVLGNAARMVEPSDVAHFADAVRSAVLTPGERGRALEQGRRLLSEYSWERSAGLLHDVYAHQYAARHRR